MAPPRIRIVLVEDNDVFREALELVLELRDDIEVVASAADGSEAAEICAEFEPDVVLMDYRMPGLDGVQATAAVRAASPRSRILCLTAQADPHEQEALLEAGAIACLSKNEEFDVIVAEIHRAAGREP